MTIAINDEKTMNRYIGGIKMKARHHGRNVTDIIPVLKALVAEYGLAGSLEIAERKDGKTGSVSWFTSKATGRRYKLGYDYASQSIRLEQTYPYRPIAKFNNQSTASDLTAVFENL